MDVQFERYVPEIIITALGTLMMLVRAGDVDKIKRMDNRIDLLEKHIPELEQRILSKLDDHAREARSASTELQHQIIAILREDRDR